MVVESHDAAFEVLLKTCADQQADISPRLLREVYDLEVRMQFEVDRTRATAAIRSAVEAEVERDDEATSEGST